MPNENKIKTVKEIEKKFNDSAALYFTKYTGMNVSQATKLRRSFSENSVEYKVSKNTLTRIAALNAGFDEQQIDKFLNGQIAIAYSESDPTAPAKVIHKFIKEHEDEEVLKVVGLIFEGTFFDAEKYKELASLPSKEELLTKLVLNLNSPMTKLASSFSSVMSKMLTVLEGVKSQKK